MSRRMAREIALQVLYQIDITGERNDLPIIINRWAKEFGASKKYLEFIRQLVEGTITQKAEIDRKIAQTAHEWSLDRMSVVDRNLMRMAIYEMIYCPETPQRVILNEAIEIAKRFGGDDTTKFINGILDKLMDAAEKEG